MRMLIFGTSGSFDLTNNGLYIETLNPDQGIGIYASTLSALGYSVSRAGDYSGTISFILFSLNILI